uniref:Uncharacterized protein n=1 Tax=Wuchereria bancrofti TaxID=6293 RepID=A0AAF5Q1Q9_WUCBA
MRAKKTKKHAISTTTKTACININKKLAQAVTGRPREEGLILSLA